MRHRLAALAIIPLFFLAPNAQAASSDPASDLIASTDKVGDLIMSVITGALPSGPGWNLKATLYHGGGRMNPTDSLGCKVVPMRTAAVDGVAVRRHTVLFIKETVGLPMPGGRAHDGYWYASDTGGASASGGPR